VKDDIHDILQCPVTGEPLRLMQPEEVALVNDRILRGVLFRTDGTPVTRRVEAGLVSRSGHLAYRVEEGIIILLSNLAIVLENKVDTRDKARAMSRETEQVQAFYDQVGWQKTNEGTYEDTARFVDTRPVLYDYLGRCNNRLLKHIATRGKYLLDVACGPIHYDAYRAMSDGYDYRICVDVSFQALCEAKKQMGDKGIYLMADITNLPLRDQSVDDVISLHTLYHVPADGQITALKEIHRALKLGGTGVVIYSWGSHSLLMRAALSPIGGLKWLRSLLSPSRQSSGTREPQLYHYAHSYRSMKREDPGFDIDTVVWSSVSPAFTKKYIPNGRFGRIILKAIWELEEKFPHLSGRFGQYPLFVIKKSQVQS
jgi:ubiquinone/menaquinone biosynthesis C-methylase UbiE/uncharacterized protein YbaR (Trm112 family)